MLPLRTTLLVNGISSGAAGILLILLTSPIAQLFGVNDTVPFLFAGIFLVFFGLYVSITATKNPINPGKVKLISILDLLWVVASLLVVMLFGKTLSTWGIILIIAVAAWVGMMALLQLKGSARTPAIK